MLTPSSTPLHPRELQHIEDEQTIAALLEANDLLGEDNSRLRNSNTVLRNVLRKLRETIAIQKKQIEQSTFNDETFKSFCQGEFDPTTV